MRKAPPVKKAPPKRVKSVEDIIDEAIMLKTEDDPLVIRKVICKFFRGKDGVGNDCDHSNNVELACAKDDCVMECRTKYIAGIFSRPQEFWTPDWEQPIAIEKDKKVSIKNAIGLNCTNCYLSDTCFAYKANHTCSIDWGVEEMTTDPKAQLDVLIEMQNQRILMARQVEVSDGGVPDQNLSNEIDRLTGMLSMKDNLNAEKFSLNISGQGQLGAAAGGGILAKLFAKEEKPAEEKVETIEVQPVEDATIITEPAFNEDIVVEQKKSKRATEKEKIAKNKK